MTFSLGSVQICVVDGDVGGGGLAFGLQVVTSQGEEVFFKIKRNTKLSKLQGAYANKVGKDVNSIRYVGYAFLAVWSCELKTPLSDAFSVGFSNRFLYEGQRISEDDTPSSLDMEENGASSLRSLIGRIC